MRAIRTTTISILALGLLAGSTIGVAAQDEAAEPTTPTKVSGTMGDEQPEILQPPTETVVDGMLEVRDVVWQGITVEFDDPRLSGTMTGILNENVHRVGDFENIVLQAGQVRIDNEAGSWFGQGTSVIHAGAGMDDEEITDFDTWVLTGSGAYEGLTAYTLWDFTEDPTAVEGVIVAGEMPPFPQLPADLEAEE